MRKVLITGGSGYIGTRLTESLLKSGYEVTVLDNLMYGQDCLLSFCSDRNFNFIYGDVRDSKLLTRLVRESDVILPLAAIVGFPACEKDKPLAKAVNCQHIYDVCDAWEPGKIIVLSQTNSGYGTSAEVCTEESPVNPVSWYGVTKQEAETAILSRTDGISLRLATLFGTSYRMRLDLLVNDFTFKALKDGYIVLFEKHFKRNYIHIQDVVSAFLFMIENYHKLEKRVYNVGLSDANLSKEELCLKIKDHIPHFSIQDDNIRKDPDQRHYVISHKRLENAGWNAKFSLDDGIKELIKAYKILLNKGQDYTNV